MSDATRQQALADVTQTMRCEFCDYYVERWNRTPQGRRWCPDCGAIPQDEQRDRDEHVLKVEVTGV